MALHKIAIGNLRKPYNSSGYVTIRCDRSSVLGNPFVMKGEVMRDEVCDQYEHYLENAILMNDSKIVEALEYIISIAKNNPVMLMCWCAPQRCHCESIRKTVIELGK